MKAFVIDFFNNLESESFIENNFSTLNETILKCIIEISKCPDDNRAFWARRFNFATDKMNKSKAYKRLVAERDKKYYDEDMESRKRPRNHLVALADAFQEAADKVPQTATCLTTQYRNRRAKEFIPHGLK